MININGVTLTPREEAVLSMAVSNTSLLVGAGEERIDFSLQIVKLVSDVLRNQGAVDELVTLLEKVLPGDEAARILDNKAQADGE